MTTWMNTCIMIKSVFQSNYKKKFQKCLNLKMVRPYRQSFLTVLKYQKRYIVSYIFEVLRMWTLPKFWTTPLATVLDQFSVLPLLPIPRFFFLFWDGSCTLEYSAEKCLDLYKGKALIVRELFLWYVKFCSNYK